MAEFPHKGLLSLSKEVYLGFQGRLVWGSVSQELRIGRLILKKCPGRVSASPIRLSTFHLEGSRRNEQVLGKNYLGRHSFSFAGPMPSLQGLFGPLHKTRPAWDRRGLLPVLTLLVVCRERRSRYRRRSLYKALQKSPKAITYWPPEL